MIGEQTQPGRFATIVDGVVINVTMGHLGDGRPCPDEVSIGWRFVDGGYQPPIEALDLPTVPKAISRQQAAAQLLIMGMVEPPEAIAMATTGTPPAFIEAIFAGMPGVDGALARIGFAKGHYERANPLLTSVLAAAGRTELEIDDFFRAAATR